MRRITASSVDRVRAAANQENALPAASDSLRQAPCDIGGPGGRTGTITDVRTLAGPPVFLGREAELDALAAVADGAAGGDPRVTLITGEAGVGKSRLVSEALSRVGDDFRVAIGGCVDIPGVEDAQLPFGPFLEALRQLRAATARHPLSPTAIAAVDGWLRPRSIPRQGSAASDPVHARFEELLALGGQLCADVPLVLVLEDLHWADRSSLGLLVFLARNLTSERLLLLATARDPLQRSEQDAVRAAVEHLLRLPHVLTLELSPMDPTQIRALVSQVVSGSPEETTMATIVARAEGNPLAACELAQKAWEDPGSAVPPTLSSSIRDRLRRISPNARTTLAAAASIGGQVEHGVLDRLLAVAMPDSDPRSRTAAVREAASTGLLVPERDGYRFRHGLDREVVYADLWPDERQALHAAAARTLSAQGLHGTPDLAAQVAAHWLRSGDPVAAREAALVAARSAAALSAFPEALSHFDNALGLWSAASPEGAGPGAGLLLEVAEAARWAGRLERGLELLEQAAVVAQTSQTAALVWERIGWFRREAGDGEQALVAYERALEAIGTDRSSAEAAEVLASHAAILMIASRYVEARQRAEEALKAAYGSGAGPARASALVTLGVVEAMIGDADEALRLLARGQAEATSCGADEQRWRAVANTTYVLRNIGRPEECIDLARAALATLPKRGNYPPGALIALSNAAESMLLLGRWAEAERLLAEGQVRQSNPYDEFTLLLQRAQLASFRGDFETTQHCLAEAELRSPMPMYPPAQAGLERIKARAALEAGDIGAARAAVDSALDLLEGLDDPEPVLDVLTVAVRVEADAGNVPGLSAPERVARFTDRLEWAEQSVGVAIVEAEVESLMCRAELARVMNAEDADVWQRVAEAARRQRQPYRVAYALSRQGEVALRDHDRRSATLLLRDALTIATHLGAQPLVDSINAVVARTRLVLDIPPGPGPSSAQRRVPARAAALGLTRREVEVLTRLIEGRTNRQIARELAMTEKTASVHVSRILTKLGAGTRGEAAAIARRLHILDGGPPPAG
jgi:tetratricopeptide (TPR) repeat protein/DNA-binding CsgD family transcriptional regulator